MQELRSILLVGAGGFLGSIGRYLLGGLIHSLLPLSTFPFGTLGVNVTGCFAIGVLAGLVESRQVLGPDARLFLLVGVLGGFTTFSSFAHETVALLRDAEHWQAALNVGGSVLLGLFAAWLGYALIRG
jgi:CrcB protein